MNLFVATQSFTISRSSIIQFYIFRPDQEAAAKNATIGPLAGIQPAGPPYRVHGCVELAPHVHQFVPR